MNEQRNDTVSDDIYEEREGERQRGKYKKRILMIMKSPLPSLPAAACRMI